jgi:hypothetical protein
MGKVKISLDGEDAPTFEDTVDIPTTRGAAPVKFTFRYRDRVEMAALFDRWSEEVKAEVAKASADQEAGVPEPTVEANARRGIQKDVEMLRELATGWNLQWSFDDDEKLALFVTKYPAAADTVLSAYRAACLRGRLGN